jgi:hypothetical protein
MSWGPTEEWVHIEDVQLARQELDEKSQKVLRRLILAGRVGLVSFCNKETQRALMGYDALVARVRQEMSDRALRIVKNEEVA